MNFGSCPFQYKIIRFFGFSFLDFITVIANQLGDLSLKYPMNLHFDLFWQWHWFIQIDINLLVPIMNNDWNVYQFDLVDSEVRLMIGHSEVANNSNICERWHQLNDTEFEIKNLEKSDDSQFFRSENRCCERIFAYMKNDDSFFSSLRSEDFNCVTTWENSIKCCAMTSYQDYFFFFSIWNLFVLQCHPMENIFFFFFATKLLFCLLIHMYLHQITCVANCDCSKQNLFISKQTSWKQRE